MPSIDDNKQPLTGKGDFSIRVKNLEWDDKLTQTHKLFFIIGSSYEMNYNNIKRTN